MPSKRLRDLALLTPLCGLVLFLPPYIQVFDQGVLLFGVPALHIGLFALWLIGICLTAWLSRQLRKQR